MYTINWIGTVVLNVLEDGKRELEFTLDEGQIVPPEFKPGDEVRIAWHPAHPAMIAMDMNNGYYDLTHVPSGNVLRILHRVRDFMFK